MVTHTTRAAGHFPLDHSSAAAMEGTRRTDRPQYFDPWWRAQDGSPLKAFAREIAEGLGYERVHSVLYQRVEAILVDLVRRAVDGFPPEVSVQMGKEYYSRKGPRFHRLHPVIEREALIGVVMAMARNGWVERKPGRQKGEGQKPWEATRVVAGDAIKAFAFDRSVDVASQIEPAEAIAQSGATEEEVKADLRLRGPKDPRTGRRADLPFPMTPQAEAMTEELRAINRWYADMGDAISAAPGSLLSTRDRSLHRVFHMPDQAVLVVVVPRFDRHGRLYGAFHVNLNKADRADVRLAGEPVAVLDYASSFLRIAYARVHREPPPGDLYAIRGLEGAPRDAVKDFIQAMLNSGHRLTQWPEEGRERFVEAFMGMGPRQVGDLVRAHHAGIANCFPRRAEKGVIEPAGPGLTFLESELMVEVLRHCRAASIPVLPLHDGLLCPWSKGQVVAKYMWEAFDRAFNRDLPSGADRVEAVVTVSQPDGVTHKLEKILPRWAARALARTKGDPAVDLMRAVLVRERSYSDLVEPSPRRPDVEHLKKIPGGVALAAAPTAGPGGVRDIVGDSGAQEDRSGGLPEWPGQLEPRPGGGRYNRRTIARHQRTLDAHWVEYWWACIGERGALD